MPCRGCASAIWRPRPRLAEAVRADLPAWNVNVFALSAAVAALGDTSDFAERARAENAERRADLAAVLSGLPGVEVFPSSANYVPFRSERRPQRPVRHPAAAFRDGRARLFQLLRARRRNTVPRRRPFPRGTPQARRRTAGSNGGRRCPKEKRGGYSPARLRRDEMQGRRRRGPFFEKDFPFPPADFPISGSSSVFPAGRSSRRTPALMLQGTSSNAGKSILAAAYCRIFRQDGYNVAPFKAQNMSLNSGVTANGDEMSRARISVQAQAARAEPRCARMNPILLKPHSDTGWQSRHPQGQPLGHMDVLEYFGKKRELWSAVTDYRMTASRPNATWFVLEGAGSPGEINLKSHDLVNMRMADYARASVLLVGVSPGLASRLLSRYMDVLHRRRTPTAHGIYRQPIPGGRIPARARARLHAGSHGRSRARHHSLYTRPQHPRRRHGGLLMGTHRLRGKKGGDTGHRRGHAAARIQLHRALRRSPPNPTSACVRCAVRRNGATPMW